MSDLPRPGLDPGAGETALLDRALGALSADDEPAADGPAMNGSALPFDGPALSVSVGAVRRFAMTVAGRIEGPPGSPGFDPSQARAVCTIKDQNSPEEPALEGVLKMSEDGSFTFTVLLEAWPEEQYPRGRLFVITVRARDRAGNLGTSTTYLHVPPAAPWLAPPRDDGAGLARPAAVVPRELLADAARQPPPTALALYVKGLHLAIKELKEERSPAPDGASV